MVNLKSGNYILFDDDCGICTKFSKFVRKLLSHKIKVIPMHSPTVEAEGLANLGFTEYWESFHVVKDGIWGTDEAAITALASFFPSGRMLSRVTEFPPLKMLLFRILKTMKAIRSQECVVDFSKP